MRKFTHTILLALMIGASSLASAESAFPHQDEVRALIQSNDWNGARRQLESVVQQDPKSAEAQYWLAQVDARMNDFDQAQQHLTLALQDDPTGTFAKPGKVQELQQQIQAHEHGGIPGWVYGGAAILVLLFAGMMLTEKRRAKQQDNALLNDATSRINTALDALRDAAKAVDGLPGLTAEQRIALSDRITQAQGDLAKAKRDLPQSHDYGALEALLERVEDLCAEAHGQELPSVRRARLQEEQLNAQAAAASSAPQGYPMGAPPIYGGGTGTGGLVQGVMAGMLLENILDRGGHHPQREGYTPPPLDTADGNASWDSTASDSGGGGFDFGGGGSGNDFDLGNDA